MGNSSSSDSDSDYSPAYVPPPSPLTSNPWRTTPEWNKEFESSLRKDIKAIEPPFKPNIVLVGPVGAGKSSYINATLSVAKGHKVDMAYTESGSKSCTTSYDRYTDKTLLQNFRLIDCMGLEQSTEEGFNVADMVSLLKGHIKNGYQFNPRSPISSENKDHWHVNPTFEDHIHCVVFVVDANVMHIGIPPAYVGKIRQIQDAVKRLRVPRVLILTKADELCYTVRDDNTNMFRSVKVKEAVKTASEVFRIPEASIHPVTNYEDADAIEISWKRNIPLLIALRQITQYTNDRIEALNDSD
ncbi:interferon-induced protein 44-like [Ruditapes philippinarum]|uniref:interferon-induced protein 44-like n=1 Tax=Ruditapes philippinarum TaxID=129788 RepID=UPI00295AAE3B|nr:interferon-induced protein 44-like [Ruditapes philippinarum]